ncbi:MAG: hypothetical protein KGZ68_12445 [Dechloromonas sp.]|nr:hypothetical protein [Dechloromonas sp.]
MSRTKKPTREDLIAQLEALDASTDVAKITTEVERLKAENADLIRQRDTVDRRNRDLEAILREIHKSLMPIAPSLAAGRPLSRGRVYTPEHDAPLREAAAWAGRTSMASVQAGIAEGTHDPRTGLPYTGAKKPPADLGAGAPKVTKRELSGFFPEINSTAPVEAIGDD